MAVSKKPGRSRAHRSGPGAGGALKVTSCAPLERLCDQLQRVATTFERIGGLVERHLRGEQVQATPQPPAAPTPVPRHEELPGQQRLPLEPERLLAAPMGRSQDPRGRPWSFRHLARVAGDLVQSDPDRTWDGNALCAALKEAGARVTSWRGLSFKLGAHLHKAGTVVLDQGNRFRAAVRPEHTSSPAPRADSSPRRRPPVRRHEPSWDDVVAAARRRLADVPTHVWTAAELTRALRQSGLGILQREGVETRLAADLRELGAIEYLDEHLFRARAPVESPPAASDAKSEVPSAREAASADRSPAARPAS